MKNTLCINNYPNMIYSCLQSIYCMAYRALDSCMGLKIHEFVSMRNTEQLHLNTQHTLRKHLNKSSKQLECHVTNYKLLYSYSQYIDHSLHIVIGLFLKTSSHLRRSGFHCFLKRGSRCHSLVSNLRILNTRLLLNGTQLRICNFLCESQLSYDHQIHCIYNHQQNHQDLRMETHIQGNHFNQNTQCILSSYLNS